MIKQKNIVMAITAVFFLVIIFILFGENKIIFLFTSINNYLSDLWEKINFAFLLFSGLFVWQTIALINGHPTIKKRQFFRRIFKDKDKCIKRMMLLIIFSISILYFSIVNSWGYVVRTDFWGETIANKRGYLLEYWNFIFFKNYFFWFWLIWTFLTLTILVILMYLYLIFMTVLSYKFAKCQKIDCEIKNSKYKLNTSLEKNEQILLCHQEQSTKTSYKEWVLFVEMKIDVQFSEELRDEKSRRFP